MFGNAKIPVIRLGLHASKEVEEQRLGGVYHPALREIVESRIFYREMLGEMERSSKGDFTVYTDPSNISKVIGQKRENKKRLSEKGYSFSVKSEKGTYLRVVPLSR